MNFMISWGSGESQIKSSSSFLTNASWPLPAGGAETDMTLDPSPWITLCGDCGLHAHVLILMKAS